MIQEVLEKYLKLYPGDRKHLNLLLSQIATGDNLSDRKNFTGHVTGSGIIFSPDLKKILLINHPSQKRWQQPGGHWDKPEIGPWETAERETKEETGVKISKKIHVSSDHRVPLSIITVKVLAYPFKDPTRREINHYHHDFRYLYIAQSEQLTLSDKVIKEARWYKLADPKANMLREEINRAKLLLKT